MAFSLSSVLSYGHVETKDLMAHSNGFVVSGRSDSANMYFGGIGFQSAVGKLFKLNTSLQYGLNEFSDIGKETFVFNAGISYYFN